MYYTIQMDIEGSDTVNKVASLDQMNGSFTFGHISACGSLAAYQLHGGCAYRHPQG